MLPQEYRLKKRTAFKATYKVNNVLHKNGITLFLGKKNNTENKTKIGFVVSKKIHKRAVKRNRIKRLMRESCRLLIKNDQISSDYMSCVFVASTKCLNQNFQEINNTIIKLFEQIC